MSEPGDQIDERTRRQLAALADGSLRGRSRTALERRVAADPELAEALRRQRAGLAAARGLDLPVPAALRTRIESARRERPAPARRARLGVIGAVAGAAAAAALIAVVVLPSGGGEPSLAQAAALGELPATEATVAVDAGDPKLLDAEVEGVPFPNLEGEFGWRRAGARRDRIDGRDAETVFYERGSERIAYTIVSGEAIDPPEGAPRAVVNGVALTTLEPDESGGRPGVTWLRDGRTCVLTAAGKVSVTELRTLASWKGDGAVPF